MAKMVGYATTHRRWLLRQSSSASAPAMTNRLRTRRLHWGDGHSKSNAEKRATLVPKHIQKLYTPSRNDHRSCIASGICALPKVVFSLIFLPLNHRKKSFLHRVSGIVRLPCVSSRSWPRCPIIFLEPLLVRPYPAAQLPISAAGISKCNKICRIKSRLA
jgi:hypothetical protein